MGLHHLGGGQGLIALVYSLDDACGELLESDAAHVVHAHDWLAVVAALADTCHERNLAQQFHIQFLGQLLAAVTAENDVLLAPGSGGCRWCREAYQ